MEVELWTMRVVAIVFFVLLLLWRGRALRAEAVLPAMDRDTMFLVDLPSVGSNATEAREHLGLNGGDLWQVSAIKIIESNHPQSWLVDVELTKRRSPAPCEQHLSASAS